MSVPPDLSSQAARLGRQEDRRFSSLPPLPPSPHCLLLRLLAATQGTQGIHLAPVVVLRAKETPGCGVSIIDNKAPRILITLLPCVLRTHNQVRRRREWRQCEPSPPPFPLSTRDTYIV